MYASYLRGRESKLKAWLDTFLDKQPGFTVIIKERHWREEPIYCRACDTSHTVCPRCGAKLGRASEKMVDSPAVNWRRALGAWSAKEEYLANITAYARDDR
ncbi:MAG: hypothetical protein AB1486_24255 [Planctomycetota bacterium]